MSLLHYEQRYEDLLAETTQIAKEKLRETIEKTLKLLGE